MEPGNLRKKATMAHFVLVCLVFNIAQNNRGGGSSKLEKLSEPRLLLTILENLTHIKMSNRKVSNLSPYKTVIRKTEYGS